MMEMSVVIVVVVVVLFCVHKASIKARTHKIHILPVCFNNLTQQTHREEKRREEKGEIEQKNAIGNIRRSKKERSAYLFFSQLLLMIVFDANTRTQNKMK